MKKIIVLNTDLKSYWKPRLQYLRRFFLGKNLVFEVIEIFGKGSPYDFDDTKEDESWWTCLFPDQDPNTLSYKEVSKKVFSTLNKANPDIIITSSIVFSSGVLGMRWVKKYNKRIMLFDDATHSKLKRNFIVNHIKKLLTSQADGYLIPTKEYDNEYTAWGIGTNRLFYGLACVDNELFRNEVPFSQKEKRIICVARLVPVKNLNRLLQAWHKVEETTKEYALTIVGDGFERKNLEETTKRLDLKCVEFLGALTSNEISRLLSFSQAFILPSLSESWGLVINEAMAAGLPIIASKNINACSSLIEEGKNGYLFDPLDIIEISEKILKMILLANDEKRKMGMISAEKIEAYSFQRLAEEIDRSTIELEHLPQIKSNSIVQAIFRIWKGKFGNNTWNYAT